jgi:hypothetical protein
MKNFFVVMFLFRVFCVFTFNKEHRSASSLGHPIRQDPFGRGIQGTRRRQCRSTARRVSRVRTGQEYSRRGMGGYASRRIAATSMALNRASEHSRGSSRASMCHSHRWRARPSHKTRNRHLRLRLRSESGRSRHTAAAARGRGCDQQGRADRRAPRRCSSRRTPRSVRAGAQRT